MTGVGFTEEEVLSTVESFRSEGHLEVTPMMILERLSPGFEIASQDLSANHPFGSVVNILEKAGRNGQLPVEGEGPDIKVVFGA